MQVPVGVVCCLSPVELIWVCLQRTYASDYIGFVLLLTGYLLVRFDCPPYVEHGEETG